MNQGWTSNTLEQLCFIEYGTRVVKKRDAGSIYPTYGGGGATFNMDEYNRQNRMVIARFAMSEQCTRFVEGKFFLNDSGLTVCPKSNSKINKRFLDYQILSLNDIIYSLGRGTAQKNLNVDKFRQLNLFYPTNLNEQKRIVAKLDQCFEAIDKARANVERNPQNARDLFQSKLNEIFSQRGEGWVEKRLGEVCIFRQGIQRGVKLQSEKRGDQQVRFLRIVDFTQGTEPPRYIDSPGEQYLLYKKDIAIVRYGASTGFVCQGIEGALANNMFRVIPRIGFSVNLDYLYFYLKSSIFQNVVETVMNGAAMPAISFGLISRIPFKVQSVDYQDKIVKYLHKFHSQTMDLETNYRQEILALDELKKSILQKAFEGELT